MNTEVNVQRVPLQWLKPAEYNPRKRLQPGDPEFEKLKTSIQEFGYVEPIVVNSDGTIIGGHQRFFVLSDLNVSEVDAVVVDYDKNKEKALNVALNKIEGEWDNYKLAELFSELDAESFELSLTGFDGDEIADLLKGVDLNEWFEERERFDNSKEDGNEEYNEFLDKFEPKKTTDDCYTPDAVYNALADWVAKEYNLDRSKFIRPFYPGGDYQKENYKGGVVVDNPPFSIMSEILNFYTEHGVKFFLFAPSLTLFSSSSSSCAICVGASITYENGAVVSTSFLTNLEDTRCRSCSELYRILKEANETTLRNQSRQLPTYEYPDYVVTSTKLAYFSKYGVDFKVERADSYHIRELESQKEAGKAIFGSGYLISEKAAAEKAAAEKAAAEKAAAEKAAAEKWALSMKEWNIVQQLGKK